jgi:alpha-1,2-mannosyltransferase
MTQWQRGRVALLAALVGLGAFVAFALSASHTKVSVDVMAADYSAWTITRTGSPRIDSGDLYAGYPLRHQFVRETSSGHEVVGRSPGVVAAALPAYRAFHPGAMTVVPGALTAAALTALALTLFFLLLARDLARQTAVFATLALGFSTPVWSVAANGMWPHTLTVLGILGLAWAARRERWWLAGAFGGVVLWGRLHAVLIVVVVAVLVALWRRDVRVLTRLAVPSVAALVAMCGWNAWVYGSWSPTAAYQTSQFSRYALEHGLSVVNQLGFWVSPDRGLLAWTPALVVLAPAVVRSWRDLPDWSRALVWGGLAYTVMQGVLDGFTGGAGFYGYRLGLEMLACLAPAVALSLPRTRPLERRVLGPVLGIQFFAIATGSVVERFYLSAPRAWTDNAFAHVISEAGLVGYALVALAAAIGVFAGHLWARRSTPMPTPTPVQARGTVSSHSVP